MILTPAPGWLVLLLVSSSGLSLYLASFAWQRRRQVQGTAEFALFMFAIAIYSSGYAIEISRTDLVGILAAVGFEYFGIVLIGPASLAFSVRYTSGRPLPRAIAACLLAYAIITILACWTTELHGLFYVDPQVTTDGPFPTLSFGKGPLYIAHLLVLELASGTAAAILLAKAIGAGRRRRRQAVVMATGGAIPLLTLLAYFAGLVPSHIDSGPFSLMLSGILFAFALFRLGFLEIVPAARELAIDALADGFIVMDRHGLLQDANPSARTMFGKEALRAEEPLDPLTLAGRSLGPLLEKGEGALEFAGPGIDGKERHFHASAYPIIGHRGIRRGTALLVGDVTGTARLMERLRELADKDGLTGLLNRRRFLEQAGREIELARRARYPLGFVIADLDHFKEVNDEYGHAAGDQALVAAARRLEGALRTVDIVCRYGGEEFAILMPGADLRAALAVAERARLALATAPLVWEGIPIAVTGSFGIHATDEPGSESLDECLSRADAALYEAKEAGRNRVSAAPRDPPRD